MIPVITEDGRGERCVIQCGGEVRDRTKGRRRFLLRAAPAAWMRSSSTILPGGEGRVVAFS